MPYKISRKNGNNNINAGAIMGADRSNILYTGNTFYTKKVL